ncbi:Bacterial transcription activator, effector binding protein [Minicystis rosea]|nr:Bacterial transcription activator, effector binding protein [Minicystis rosea]
MTTADDHRRRFQRVLEHIDAHPEEALTVDDLSRVAAFSKYHFHRQFSALFGISISRYVQLVRVRRAAHELAFRRRRRILEIALGSGYESHEAFARIFKKMIGQTPSEFRERPAWEGWHAIDRRLNEARSQPMKTEARADDVRIVDFPQTRIAILSHRGDPDRIGDTVRTFIAWRKATGYVPAVSATFNILHGDPRDVAPGDFRLDLCASVGGPVADNPQGVVEGVIPAGRCAVLRHVGSDAGLGEALRFLYATWLPASSEEPRDVPRFVQRIRFFPDVPEHEAVLDVFLPLR